MKSKGKVGQVDLFSPRPRPGMTSSLGDILRTFYAPEEIRQLTSVVGGFGFTFPVAPTRDSGFRFDTPAFRREDWGQARELMSPPRDESAFHEAYMGTRTGRLTSTVRITGLAAAPDHTARVVAVHDISYREIEQRIFAASQRALLTERALCLDSIHAIENPASLPVSVEEPVCSDGSIDIGAAADSGRAVAAAPGPSDRASGPIQGTLDDPGGRPCSILQADAEEPF